MRTNHWDFVAFNLAFVALLLASAPCAHADVVTDANTHAADIASTLPATPPAVRALAIVQVAVFEAVNAISGRYPSFRVNIKAVRGASIDAAVAAATHVALLKLVPAKKTAIDADYQAALALVPDGVAKRDGIADGEQAAAAVVSLRSEDGMIASDEYRPHAAAGVYVPTTLPAVPHWGRRKPWLMSSGDQFRPPAPPGLTSEIWARDFNESKALGARTSTQRTAEQTAIAHFWAATVPAIYWPVARAVATRPGRDVTDNARLLAVAAVAMDDAVIAVFDAKYAYNFWRPITAIRNGDLDGNDATAREPGWMPLIDTPMHPEYPCAHCIVSAALGTVLEAELGNGPVPKLSSTSPTAPGMVRTWSHVADFVQEVSAGRIYDGVHFRHSTEVGTAMGKRIGELAVKSFPGKAR